MSATAVPHDFPAAPSADPPVGLRHRIPSLDGLRAVSILLVVGCHAFDAVTQRTKHHDYHGLWSIIISGNLGVSVFFVISGFLITQLLLGEMDKTGTIGLPQFYLRRTFRIWPAFYVYLAAVVVLHKLRLIGLGPPDVWAAATFTFNYLPWANQWWVGHSWSLSVEEQFYLVWPAVLLMVGRRNAVGVAIALLFFAPAARLVETLLVPDSWWVTRMWQTAHTRVDTLMYGCLLALLWHSPRLHRAITFARKYWLAVPVVLIPTVGSYFLLIDTAAPVYRTLQYTIEGISITALVALLVTTDRSPIGRLFNSAAVVHLGRISFSLYLWQQLFLTSLNNSWTGRLPVSLLCAWAAAELSYHLIEQPALALRSKWFSKKKTV